MSPVARIDYIDGLRGLAVITVLVSHVALHARSMDGALTHFLLEGSHGVDLFFVLSGFCLSYPYLARGTAKPLPSIGDFLRHRFARIAPPYYVALVLFGALAFTKFGLPTWPERVPGALARLRELGLDAIFLTNAMPMHNADFWTLGVEMRWYVVFPLILGAFVRSKPLFLTIAASAIALYRSPASIADLGMLTCFMSGIVAAAIARSTMRIRIVGPAAIVALCLALIEQKLAPGRVDHGDLLWQLAMFLIVVAATLRGSRLATALSHRWLEAVGVASYSIYLINHPVFDAAMHVGFPRLAAVALAIGAGFLFWACVERPLLRRPVRARIENALRLPIWRKQARRPASAPRGA
jgi:peptidoglycan/LPS O-acetylase OafA/YrhL